MLSLYDSLESSLSNFVKFILKKCKKDLAQACKPLKSLSKRPWGSTEEIIFYLLFLFACEKGGENKIISLSKILSAAGRFTI